MWPVSVIAAREWTASYESRTGCWSCWIVDCSSAILIWLRSRLIALVTGPDCNTLMKLATAFVLGNEPLEAWCCCLGTKSDWDHPFDWTEVLCSECPGGWPWILMHSEWYVQAVHNVCIMAVVCHKICSDVVEQTLVLSLIINIRWYLWSWSLEDRCVNHSTWPNRLMSFMLSDHIELIINRWHRLLLEYVTSAGLIKLIELIKTHQEFGNTTPLLKFLPK